MEFHSPLRYPRGKGKIANYIKLIFEKNELADGLYIEPYSWRGLVRIIATILAEICPESNYKRF